MLHNIYNTTAKSPSASCYENRGALMLSWCFLFAFSQALTQLLAGVLDRSLGGWQNYRAFKSQYRFTCPVRLRDSPCIFPSQSSILRGKELFREEDAESIHTETDASAVVKMVRQVFPSVQSGKTESFYG